MEISFEQLKDEVIEKISCEKSIVLATSADDKVTARTMSHVNDGLILYFQTGGNSEKAAQIFQNKSIAFAVSNMQIEATAEICGHPHKEPAFTEQYKAKFPNYYTLYSSIPEEIVIKAVPVKVTLYKYLEGKPCREILDIIGGTACREF